MDATVGSGYCCLSVSAWLCRLSCRVPVSAVSIATPAGTMEAMARSVDNYWIADSGTYTFPTTVSITSIFGDTVTDTVNVASPTGAVMGKAQFPLNAAYETVGGMIAGPLLHEAYTTFFRISLSLYFMHCGAGTICILPILGSKTCVVALQ